MADCAVKSHGENPPPTCPAEEVGEDNSRGENSEEEITGDTREENREQSSPAPSYDLVEREDPDEFVSVDAPVLNDEDEGRTVVPLGRRGGLLRRARKTKRNEPDAKTSEGQYTGDISQLTTDEDHLFTYNPERDSILRGDMLVSLSRATLEASTITTASAIAGITSDTDELVTPADEESTKEATRARLGSMSLEEREREFEDEDVTSPSWAAHYRHVFILSISGKPIYSRYGKEEKLVSMFGVMQALVSIVQDDKNTLRCIETGSHRMVFVSRQPLVMVAVSRSQQSEQQLTLQLLYCYYQILSVLTNSQLQHIYERSPGFDLRHLLQGSEKFIDNILNLTSTDPSYLLSGVRCLTMPVTLRQGITSIITQCKTKDVLFALLIANNQLITYLRPKEHHLHPIDIHVIFNLVDASTSFRSAESWTPICLPKFNDTGFLHAYVCYLPDNSQACLLLVSTNREKFFELQQCKEKIIEKMEKLGFLEQINTAISKADYSTDHLQAPQIRHFVYKSRKTASITAPQIPSLYSEEEDQQRLFDHYMMINQKLVSQTWPTKILYHVGAHEAVLGWRTANFDLYVVFDPLISKPQAIMLGNKLIRWINREEDKLIITSTYTF